MKTLNAIQILFNIVCMFVIPVLLRKIACDAIEKNYTVKYVTERYVMEHNKPKKNMIITFKKKNHARKTK